VAPPRPLLLPWLISLLYAIREISLCPHRAPLNPSPPESRAPWLSLDAGSLLVLHCSAPPIVAPCVAAVRGEVTDWVELAAGHGGAQSYYGSGRARPLNQETRTEHVAAAKVGFLRPIIISSAATPRRRGIQGWICALGCPGRGPIAVENVRKHIKRPGNPIAHPDRRTAQQQ
jgi:hypothetical protein